MQPQTPIPAPTTQQTPPTLPTLPQSPTPIGFPPSSVITAHTSSDQHHPTGCFKKIFIGLGIFIGVIVLLAVLGFFFGPKALGLFAKDIAPIDDSDLLPKQVTVPDQNNAFFDLKGVDALAQEPSTVFDYIALKKWDDADVARILEQNKDALAKWDTATLKPGFQDPLYADLSIPADFKPGFPTVFTGYQKLARLNALRGLARIKAGQTEAGVNTLFQNLEIGKKMQSPGSGGLVTKLVGIAIYSLGIQSLENGIQKLNLTSAQALELQKSLDDYPVNSEGLSEGFKQNYFVEAYHIDQVTAGKQSAISSPVVEGEESAVYKVMRYLASSKFYFEPNKTKKLHADLYRKEIADAGSTCSGLPEDAAFKRDPTLILDWWRRENGIGQLTYEIGGTVFTGLERGLCNQRVDVAATKLLLALQAYKLEKKSIPDTLDQLVPQYIPVIQTDPYDDKPLKYSAEKQIIYSVGPNKIDDHGVGDPRGNNSKDYIVPIY